nr:hypothetical protein [Bacilli bacterium]
MAKIAFLCVDESMATWIINESKSFTFTAQIGNDKSADAYIAMAMHDEDIDKYLPIVQDQMFAWFGVSNDVVKALKPFEFATWDEISDGDAVLQCAERMSQ